MDHSMGHNDRAVPLSQRRLPWVISANSAKHALDACSHPSEISAYVSHLLRHADWPLRNRLECG